jgi:hypothetical protein
MWRPLRLGKFDNTCSGNSQMSVNDSVDRKQPSSWNKFRLLVRRIRILPLAFALATGILIGHFSSAEPSDYTQLSELRVQLDMNSCISSRLAIIAAPQPQKEDLRELTDQCFTMLRSQGLVNDYQLRRLTFIQQFYANKILLWMVVLITLSGLVLAGLQLGMSYDLAVRNVVDFGRPSELILKKDEIVLRSSVTGMFILCASFAFFMGYVLYVYKYQEVNVDSVKMISPELLGKMLPHGGMGPPP